MKKLFATIRQQLRLENQQQQQLPFSIIANETYIMPRHKQEYKLMHLFLQRAKSKSPSPQSN